MELSSPKIKTFLILYNPNLKIFPRKKFLIFFPKNSYSEKFLIFPIFQDRKLSGPKIKNFLIFSQKNIFLYFGKRNFLA